MAYLNEHEIYCDPNAPTPGCAECEIEEEQRNIEAEEARELEEKETALYECDACGMRVPQDQIETRVAYGLEGDFCAKCRGVETEEKIR